MSSDIIQTFGGVRGYEENDVVYLHIDDVARGLGFTYTASSGNEVVRWNRVEEYLSGLGFVATSGDDDNPHDYYIPENIFYRLCMKARNDFAETFQAKVADEIIPSIRRHGMYATKDFIQRSISDPEWAIAVLQKLKFETEQRELAEKQRDEAIRTKAHFVEGRDAEMCGRVGGLTKANTDLRQKNTQLTSENNELKIQVGDAENLKSVKSITWLKEFFFFVNKSQWNTTLGSIGKELKKICISNKYEYRKIPDSNYGTVYAYDVRAIEIFKAKLLCNKQYMQRYRN